MKKIRENIKLAALLVGLFSVSYSTIAAAHVVVKPSEAVTGSFETFTVSVPNEKELATTAVKVEMPEGIEFVTPTVKSGWTIDVEKEGSGEDAEIKAITWSGGTLEPGFRDDFTFSAKVPAKVTELRWNAYQTYQDGLVVAWNLSENNQPKKAGGSPDFSTSGPYSVTKVTNAAAPVANSISSKNEDKANIALLLASAAVLISLVTLYFATRKPSTKHTL